MSQRRLRILVAESSHFSENALKILNDIGSVALADLDYERLLSAVHNVDVLWVRLRHRIASEVMDSGQDLRFILSATTGLDHIDLEAAAERKIQVISLQGERGFLTSVRATAEHTLALALALLRRLPVANRDVLRGGWNRMLFIGSEIHGKTVGVVGFGRVGRQVAELFRAFGATVLVNDVVQGVGSIGAGRWVEFLTLEQVLSRADIVTLHTPLGPETQPLLGAREFGQMKRGAWLLNTARGQLIDEVALLDALNGNLLSGAALDVLGGETSQGMNTHPLVEYARLNNNLLITPHIAGCTLESFEKTEMFLARKLRDIVAEGTS